MENEILRIVADILERSPEELHLDQTFEELEIYSILFIRMVVQCETTLSIQFEDEMLLMSRFPVLGDFVHYVEQRGEGQGEMPDESQTE